MRRSVPSLALALVSGAVLLAGVAGCGVDRVPIAPLDAAAGADTGRASLDGAVLADAVPPGRDAGGPDAPGAPDAALPRDAAGSPDVVVPPRDTAQPPPDAADAGGSVPACANGRLDAGEADVDCGGACAPCLLGRTCRGAVDCLSGLCQGGRCVAPATCDDGARNGGESDIDCGGPCRACASGRECIDHGDCLSATCLWGVCRDPSCEDGVRNQGESDADCGGPCADCVDGSLCGAAGDCRSGRCTGGRCTSCADGARNGGETDVDCGGPCSACADGRGCGVAFDCRSARCTDGVCTSCADGARNGGETDVDCGGPCAGCADGRLCAGSADCRSGLCQAGRCVAPASCSDGLHNGDESDTDCGGSCDPCRDGDGCGAGRDCRSGRCTAGVCTSCTDGARNGGETDTDCGGPCARCATGRLCGDGDDCLSGRCTAGVCTSCTDGARNGGETDVDCGGPCGGCVVGRLCGVHGDCLSGRCEAGRCCTPNACGICGAPPAEVCNGRDDDCDGSTDEPAEVGVGALCPQQQGGCEGARARCAGAAGFLCDAAAYRAHDPGYEPVEQTCDGWDNDCDGVVDGGRVCDICRALPPPVELGRIAADPGWSMSHADWLALTDDRPIVVLCSTPASFSPKLVYVRDGRVTGEQLFETGVYAHRNVAIRSDGTTLHGASSHWTGWYDRVAWYRFGFPILMAETWRVPEVDFVALALADGVPWLLHGPRTGPLTLSRRRAADDWETIATVTPPTPLDTAHLAVTGDGTAFLATVDRAVWVKRIMAGPVGQARSTVCNDNDHCEPDPVLRVGPDGVVWLLYGQHPLITPYEAGPREVRLRSWTGSGWSAGRLVDEGYAGNLTFAPDGTLVVVYWRDRTHLWLARSADGETWDTEPLWTAGDGVVVTDGLRTGVAVDSDGRVHVTAATVVGDRHVATYLLWCPETPTTCRPDCSGRDCGADGCGGSCGVCESGESCVGDRCLAPDDCGYNPARSCQGKCGYNYSGHCACTSDCRYYPQGCCPDRVACCRGK